METPHDASKFSLVTCSWQRPMAYKSKSLNGLPFTSNGDMQKLRDRKSPRWYDPFDNGLSNSVWTWQPQGKWLFTTVKFRTPSISMEPGSGVSSKWFPWNTRCRIWCDVDMFNASIESILLLRNFSVPTLANPSNAFAHTIPKSDSCNASTTTFVKPRNVYGDNSDRSIKANFNKPTASIP